MEPSIDKSHTNGYPKWHNIAAGALAGAGARFLTAPLDLLKIRRQISTIPSESTPSLITTAKNIVQQEGGIRGLFRGNLSGLYLWVAYAAIQLSLYARTSELLTIGVSQANTHATHALPEPLRALHDDIASRPAAVAFVSGAMAGVCATVATYPFDICRTAFAAQGLASSVSNNMSPPSNVVDFSRRMVRNHGIKGFFAGISPAIIQIVPYMGINFALYDMFTRLSDRHSVFNAGAAGTISGGVSKIIVYPLDTVKKRLQAQTFSSLLHSTPTTAAVNLSNRFHYKGMVDCIILTAKEESIWGFYRGMVPSVMKNAAATGLTFAFFTLSKNCLEAAHDSKINKRNENEANER